MKKSAILVALFTLLDIAVFAASKTVNVKDVPALITSTYIWGLIFVAIFIVLSIIISNLIKFEGGTNPKDPGKRRMWFWILAIIAPLAFFGYNYLLVVPNVKVGPALNKFFIHIPITSGIILVAYIIIGFVLAKIMSTGKIGNWFPSKKQ